jgi:predicted esterase
MAAQPPPFSLPPGALFVPAPGGSGGASAVPRPPNLLVLLHGRGDGPGPFARLATQLALPGTAVLALRGPVRCGPGHTWWAEDEEEDEEDEDCSAALAARRPALAATLDGLGWPRHRVHLFGFGDGGTAVLDLAVAAAAGELGPGPAGSAGGGQRWGSAVTVGAALPLGALAPGDFAGGGGSSAGALPHRTTPVLMTAGERDPALPPALASATLTALRTRLGLPDAKLHTVAGAGGGMLGRDPGEARAAMQHWARCLSGPVPAGCVEVE